MDALWLLYDEADLALNLGFVELMRDRGHARGLDIVPVTTQELTLGLDPSGMPVCLRAGAKQHQRAQRRQNPRKIFFQVPHASPQVVFDIRLFR